MSKRKRKSPFEKGSITSEVAAGMLVDLEEQEQAVLAEFFNIAPRGMTDEELETVTGLLHQSASARRRGLVLKGRLRDSGEIKLNHTKRPAIIWVLGKEKEKVVAGEPSPRGSRPSKKDFARAVEELHHSFLDKKKLSPTLEKVMLWLGMLSVSGGAPE
jgi:hypothetical protein